MRHKVLDNLLPILGLMLALGTLLVGLSGAVSAQGPEPPSFEILLKSGQVVLNEGQFAASGHRYVVVQFRRNLRLAEIENLRDNGVNLLSFLYNNAWIAAVEPGALTPTVVERYAIAAAMPWRAEFKAPISVKQGRSPDWALTADGSTKLLVAFFKDVTRAQVEGVLSQYTSQYEVYREPDLWAVEIAPDGIEALLQESLVYYAEEGPRPMEPLLDDSRQIGLVNAVQDIDTSTTPPTYNGLSGQGVNLQVSEPVTTAHPDFWDYSGASPTSRFINPGTGGSDHGTHVAGIIGGNGWNSDKSGNTGTPYQWRGMAPEARLFQGEDFSGQHDIHASNHSYVMAWGTYDWMAASVDRQIRGDSGINLQWPQVWAAANQGVHAWYDDEEGYYSMYAPAKNAIAVGSVNANDGSLSAFSSLGPTFDGRIKPDVVAPGGKNPLPQTFDYYSTAVTIDWIRIVNTSTNQVDLEWSFDIDGDLEGWLGLGDYRIYDRQVSGGTFRFSAGVEGYTHNYSVTLDANENHVIQMRYKMHNSGGAIDCQSNFLWRLEGDPSHYVNGMITFDARVDDTFRVVTIPVGQEGLRLDPRDFSVIGPGGWTGTINMLRLDVIGRLVPFGIVSTAQHEDGSYGYVEANGTSMAAPATTGIAGLMLQQFVETHGVDLDVNPPLPSTVKAILVHTATDLVHDVADPRDLNNPDLESQVPYGTHVPVLYHKGPDFATGYGLVNAWAAVKFIEDAAHTGGLPVAIHESELDANQVETFQVAVPDTHPGELKVTLVWDDYEASPALSETVPHLVNDLDLLLIDPSGMTHYPWTLEPLPVADCSGAGPGCGDLDPIRPTDIVPAFRGPDHRNNVEMVQVDNPAPGSWVVVVRAHNLPAPLQSYSLVYSVNRPGKIVVANDEWPLSDQGFPPAQDTDAAQFARNVAHWFTGGQSGNFLVYSVPFGSNTGLVGTDLATTMVAAGHTWTIISTPTNFSLDDLLPYDAVFLAGTPAHGGYLPLDSDVLISYVMAGGNVYLAGGTDGSDPRGEAEQWNPFLRACGLDFAPASYQNDVDGVLKFNSSHPIFAGVGRLYQRNGNFIRNLAPWNPSAAILVQSEHRGGLYAVCTIGAPIEGAPTAIDLLSFTAQAGADRVTLAWETGTEVDNAGFNLWRSEAAEGEYVQINDALIPAEGDAVSGASYTYDDANVVEGVTYYYKLEDVDVHGASTFHGPVSATPGRIHLIYLPLVLK